MNIIADVILAIAGYAAAAAVAWHLPHLIDVAFRPASRMFSPARRVLQGCLRCGQAHEPGTACPPYECGCLIATTPTGRNWIPCREHDRGFLAEWEERLRS